MRKAMLEKINQQSSLTTLSAALFFGWIQVVPFDGYILNLLFEAAGLHDPTLGSMLIGVHLLGLFICAITLKRIHRARQLMLGAVVVCLISSLSLFSDHFFLWYLAAMIMAFSSGLYVAAWGCFLKEKIPSGGRLTAVADVLIGATLVVIVIDVFTMNWNIWSGKMLALVVLLLTILAVLRLKPDQPEREAPPPSVLPKESASVPYLQRTLIRPFMWLCVFIIIITLNAGLMIRVAAPVFRHLTLLTSFYWAIPYIIALLILRNLPQKANRAFTLYIALAMMGFSYLLFIRLPASAGSFIVMNTFMMGSMGVFDLFWWSLMASFLDYARRPAAILGLGMSANALGVLLGGVAGADMIHTTTSYGDVSLTAFAVIFVGLAILPLLNLELSRLFKRHIFLVSLSPYRDKVEHTLQEQNGSNDVVTSSDANTTQQKQKFTSIPPDPLEVLQDLYQLTEREVDIITLLQRGYTYRAISENLGITENTTKFHAKNIYQKLHVSNKMDLLKTISPIMDEDAPF